MKIEINDDLYRSLEGYLKETSFTHIGELVTFILKDYLEKNNNNKEDNSDKDVLQERLKNLGYL